MMVRSITGLDGGQWRVTYIQPAIMRRGSQPYRVAPGCFCFTGPDARCVCSPRELFSGDWRRVSAHELGRLLADVLAQSTR